MTQTLLSTAKAVHAGLVPWQATDLDWSVAALPLCKAVEVEIGRLIALRLREATRGLDLGPDAAQNKLKAMVRYCRSAGDEYMMLGPFISFLEGVTAPEAAHGSLAMAVRVISRAWPRADWLFDPNGLAAALDQLRRRYRNPAAHTEILDRAAFEECSTFVAGPDGLLWRLVLSTRPRWAPVMCHSGEAEPSASDYECWTVPHAQVIMFNDPSPHNRSESGISGCWRCDLL
jgi:hypothetical protein